MNTILRVCHLNKSFGKQEVLTNLNFEIQRGDIVGLIGKNGCGKTTLMKMILGLTPRTKGKIQFKGDSEYNTKRNSLNKIGFLLDCKLFEDFSAYDNLKLFSMYSSSFDKSGLDKRINKLLKFVGLDSSKKLVKSYSFGMKQRLGLALALLDDPEFLILDEPFVGLDPIGVKNLLEILKQWSKVNKTSMIISSHQLAELEDLCTRYLFIESGIIDDKISTEQNSIIIELNEIFRDEDNHLIENLVKKYSLKYSENNIEIDNSVNNEALNSILEQLAVAKLINNVLSKKDSLERLFVEE